ncbi:histidine kinase [Sulfolobales archaeon HS-7]|nr:histidine kinase [Sulfolobales archaeon HS-7]
MTIRSSFLIKRQPISIGSDATISDAIRVMAENNIGSLLVSETGKVVGIVTERDVIKGLSKGRKLNESIKTIATIGPLIYVYDDEGIDKVAKLMKDHFIRHVVVKNRSGEIMGVISIRDLLGEEKVLEALSAIPEQSWAGSD